MSRVAAPFSLRAVLALVIGGSVLFVLMLWLIGTGLGNSQLNNGAAHAASKGLTGYAALADYLERRGQTVNLGRTPPALAQGDLLILTPPAGTSGAELARQVERRRYQGPTMVILPKWSGSAIPRGKKEYRRGWVVLRSARAPVLPGFRDDLSVELGPMRAGGAVAAWTGAGQTGALGNSENVLSGRGEDLVPLVVGKQDGRILVGYINDTGDYPALRDIAARPAPEPLTDDEGEIDYELHPLIIVFEPDLINNYGFADKANALLAERLVKAALGNHEGHDGVTFDLTLNGFGRSQNLLTLAFQPPFLAATLCLLVAAVILGWRALLRFGPAIVAGPAVAYGKAALVGNAAALLRRAKRLYLVGPPYADALRERLARALALPARLDPAAAEAAIDRALAARDAAATPFSQVAARMRAARRPADLVATAQALHSLERIVKR